MSCNIRKEDLTNFGRSFSLSEISSSVIGELSDCNASAGRVATPLFVR